VDRATELNAFKELNLSLIASAHGFALNGRKSTRHSILMERGSDKIIIARQGAHAIYCSVTDPNSSGTVIDFAQRIIEPGCSLGRVRQLLRPYLGASAQAELQQKYAGRYATELKPSVPDLLGVAARFAEWAPLTGHHDYLCTTRGIAAELLASPRLRNRVYHCPRRGAAAFPHWGHPLGGEPAERCLVGYEIKGPGVNLFSKGGQKGLWISAGHPDDRVLAFSESGLDALSYLALRGTGSIRIASISGKLNAAQPPLIRAAIERMEEGARIVAAFDNDPGGDELTATLAKIVAEGERSDVEFAEDRPQNRGADWNDSLREHHRLRRPTLASDCHFRHD